VPDDPVDSADSVEGRDPNPYPVTDTGTFMGVPRRDGPPGSGAAILGIPFDCGTHPIRIGSRYGPHAIRQQSDLLRPYQPPHADFDPLARLEVVDCGNVDVTPGNTSKSFPNIERAVGRIAGNGAIPVTMGGDGSVTLPQLRGLHGVYPTLAVLHLDAHTDTGPGSEPGEISTSTTFTRAAEEGVVDAEHSIHLGARGTQRRHGAFEFAEGCGYEVISGDDLFERGIGDVLVHLRKRLSGRPLYLCFDMDFFDPSCAPGVCQPEWGGPSVREILAILQGLSGLDFVAFDVNTVSPPHDVGGMTALLAARVMLECLVLACGETASI
jgi:agmatinase